MKNLNSTQIELVQNHLTMNGVTSISLLDDLTDHVLCLIEQSETTNFQEAFSEVVSEFGDSEIENIQKQTSFLIHHKNQITMKKVMFTIGYLSATLITTGILFKIQHWPAAGILLTLGIVVLNLGFLPMYFYSRYKDSIPSV